MYTTSFAYNVDHFGDYYPISSRVCRKPRLMLPIFSLSSEIAHIFTVYWKSRDCNLLKIWKVVKQKIFQLYLKFRDKLCNCSKLISICFNPYTSGENTTCEQKRNIAQHLTSFMSTESASRHFGANFAYFLGNIIISDVHNTASVFLKPCRCRGC